MTTITLPPDLESALVQSASRAGTTPESLAIDTLRRSFPTPPDVAQEEGGSLLDFLGDSVGAVSGSSEPLSSDGGRLFAEWLAEKHDRERP